MPFIVSVVSTVQRSMPCYPGNLEHLEYLDHLDTPPSTKRARIVRKEPIRNRIADLTRNLERAQNRVSAVLLTITVLETKMAKIRHEAEMTEIPGGKSYMLHQLVPLRRMLDRETEKLLDLQRIRDEAAQELQTGKEQANRDALVAGL